MKYLIWPLMAAIPLYILGAIQLLRWYQLMRCDYWVKLYNYSLSGDKVHIYKVYERPDKPDWVLFTGLTHRGLIVYKDSIQEHRETLLQNMQATKRMYKEVDMDALRAEHAYQQMLKEERDNMVFSEEEISAEQRRLALEEAARKAERAWQDEEYERQNPLM